MARIVKTITGQADVIITETYIDEEAASNKETEPETRDVQVTELKIENTKWRKEIDE